MHDSYKQGDKKIMGEDEGDETIYFVCSTTCKNKQFHEDAGSIPGFSQRVKDPALLQAMV